MGGSASDWQVAFDCCCVPPVLLPYLCWAHGMPKPIHEAAMLWNNTYPSHDNYDSDLDGSAQPQSGRMLLKRYQEVYRATAGIIKENTPD